MTPCAVGITAEILSARREAPDADEKVLVAAKVRRRVREVGAAAASCPERPSGSPTVAMAPTHDSRHRFCFTRPTAMNDRSVDDAGLAVRADGQPAEVRVADAPVHLAASENRHFVCRRPGRSAG